MRFDVNDQDRRWSVTDVLDHLQTHGYVIIERLMSDSLLSELRGQVQVYLDSTGTDQDNAFMGSRSKRFGRLLHRIPATHDLALNPFILCAADKILLPYSSTYQLHFTGAMHLLEGEKAQVLHRDITPFANPSPSVVLAVMWAMNDFTKENGATVFVPGSHLWPEDRCPTKEELAVAEMPAGSAFLYVGNLIHGAGSCKKGSRTGVNMQYSVSWLRQEENQYLAVPLDEAKTFDIRLQKLMGYDLASRHWGYVDQTHPLDFLRGEDVCGTLAPQGYEFKDNVRMLRATPGDLYSTDFFPVELD